MQVIECCLTPYCQACWGGLVDCTTCEKASGAESKENQARVGRYHKNPNVCCKDGRLTKAMSVGKGTTYRVYKGKEFLQPW